MYLNLMFNSQRVAEQLFDTNVNCGQVAAIKMGSKSSWS